MENWTTFSLKALIAQVCVTSYNLLHLEFRLDQAIMSFRFYIFHIPCIFFNNCNIKPKLTEPLTDLRRSTEKNFLVYL